MHRWQPAADGTIITGNRVERIRATKGGTGQNGNGINIFRAGNVIVANNVVGPCAFSAIRANSASNIQITANNCTASGETAIYSEFAFEGAVVSSNIVDGAANGISMVNFNAGGRMAVCSGNLVRNLSTKGPYAADPPGFAVIDGIGWKSRRKDLERLHSMWAANDSSSMRARSPVKGVGKGTIEPRGACMAPPFGL